MRDELVGDGCRQREKMSWLQLCLKNKPGRDEAGELGRSHVQNEGLNSKTLIYSQINFKMQTHRLHLKDSGGPGFQMWILWGPRESGVKPSLGAAAVEQQLSTSLSWAGGLWGGP